MISQRGGGGKTDIDVDQLSTVSLDMLDWHGHYGSQLLGDLHCVWVVSSVVVVLVVVVVVVVELVLGADQGW